MAMFKTSLGGFVDGAKAQTGYVETDPSCRYGRFRDVLGKGAMKTVYRAFDEVLGMEVAWNQVKLSDVFGSPEELQRLYSEVHLLKNLSHDHIIKFFTSWIDIDRRTFNFITELFTSGTLREYRKKYQRVDIRAVKNWARQILRGLAHLHGHDPPVIHRDLKCDNIFVNGHLGQVKIGDLGLAAILRGSQHAHSVIGTPEFMAPELYEEEYNELVDVYSFGMCVLEMLTGEYPYSECSNPAQIYKKVTSGKLPADFYRITDPEAQKFVGKCLESASKRLPARELLLDPFLASDEATPEAKLPILGGIAEEIVSRVPADPAKSTDMMITGTMNPEDDTIFLKVQISDHHGHTRNIYFPFDIMNDTAMDVAMEMVKELEIDDLEPLKIAVMIEEEITSLIPNWKPYHRQHSFNYKDDDGTFSSPSSHSSSHASLFALGSSCDPNPFSSAYEWISGEVCNNDDASSQSSESSYKYSNLKYYSEKEDVGLGMARNSTRFCPVDLLNAKKWEHQNRKDYGMCGSSNSHKKLSRIRSLVDVRSQLLHRSLVEEIHKRRLFKTVGAVENIGFREPGLPDKDDDEKKRFKW